MNDAAHYAAIFAGLRPTIESPRLLLRPFVPDDGAAIERHAGEREVARTLLAMPHSCPGGAAVTWITRFETGHHHAEVGYWLRHDRWGTGIVTEATAALSKWAFRELGLNRVFARHMAANPASGAVMRKTGMTLEGTLRQHYEKNGAMHDFHIYGILREEFFAQQPPGPDREHA